MASSSSPFLGSSPGMASDPATLTPDADEPGNAAAGTDAKAASSSAPAEGKKRKRVDLSHLGSTQERGGGKRILLEDFLLVAYTSHGDIDVDRRTTLGFLDLWLRRVNVMLCSM